MSSRRNGLRPLIERAPLTGSLLADFHLKEGSFVICRSVFLFGSLNFEFPVFFVGFPLRVTPRLINYLLEPFTFLVPFCSPVSFFWFSLVLALPLAPCPTPIFTKNAGAKQVQPRPWLALVLPPALCNLRGGTRATGREAGLH